MIALRKAPSSYDERFMDTMANEYLERTPWTELRLEAVRDLVDPQRGDRILDLGCAAGAMTHYLSTFGAESVGIDFEELAIAKARQLFPDCAFEIAERTLSRLRTIDGSANSPSTRRESNRATFPGSKPENARR